MNKKLILFMIWSGLMQIALIHSSDAGSRPEPKTEAELRVALNLLPSYRFQTPPPEGRQDSTDERNGQVISFLDQADHQALHRANRADFTRNVEEEYHQARRRQVALAVALNLEANKENSR